MGFLKRNLLTRLGSSLFVPFFFPFCCWVFCIMEFCQGFHQSFLHLVSFFLLCCGACEHTPFFHNTPFQFDHWLEKCIFSASTGYEPKLFVYKTYTRVTMCFGWLFDAFLFHYKCVFCVRGRSLFRDIWCNFFVFKGLGIVSSFWVATQDKLLSSWRRRWNLWSCRTADGWLIGSKEWLGPRLDGEACW